MRTKPERRRRTINLVLTPRDLELLEAVASHGLLTRDQLQRILAWPCTTRINARLRKLFDLGYLDRRFATVRKGSAPALYTVGAQAVSILAERLKRDPGEIQKARMLDRRLSDQLLRHAIAVNEVAASFRSACDVCPKGLWLEWLNERELVSLCSAGDTKGSTAVRPDGYGKYGLSNRGYNFFLELDTGSESAGRVRRKIDGYTYLMRSGRFKAAFGLENFRVLIVTLTERRAHSIRKRIDSQSTLLIRIGHMDAVTPDPLFGPVWWPPSSGAPVVLHHPLLTNSRSA